MKLIPAKWKTPAILIANASVALSLATNLVQWRQNALVNNKARQETTRADQAAEDLSSLQQKKNTWLSTLDQQDRELDRQIAHRSEKLRLHRISTQYDIFHSQQVAADSAAQDSLTLYQLQQQKLYLRKERSDFLSNWH